MKLNNTYKLLPSILANTIYIIYYSKREGTSALSLLLFCFLPFNSSSRIYYSFEQVSLFEIQTLLPIPHLYLFFFFAATEKYTLKVSLYAATPFQSSYRTFSCCPLHSNMRLALASFPSSAVLRFPHTYHFANVSRGKKLSRR